MSIVQRVGRTVKRLRIARGWTQQELADRIDVRRPYITQIESATRGVSLEILEQLAKALRAKPAALLE